MSDDTWKGTQVDLTKGGAVTIESLNDTLKYVALNASSLNMWKWENHESPLIRLIEKHKKFTGRPHYGTTDISNFVYLLGRILIKNKYPDYFAAMEKR